MIGCICCVKKRAELYIARHPELFHGKCKNSNENIPGNQRDPELGEVRENMRNETELRQRNTLVEGASGHNVAEHGFLPQMGSDGRVVWNTSVM